MAAFLASVKSNRKQMEDNADPVDNRYSMVPAVGDIEFDVELGVLTMNG